MKKLILTSSLVLLTAVSIFAQNRTMVNEAQLKAIGYEDVFDQMNNAESHTSAPHAKTIIPANNYIAPAPSGVQAVSPLELGRASNAFTILNQAPNQIYADDDLNMVAFIHRHDVTIYGGGGTENGKYRYDFSTDGGTTFTTDIGPMQTIYTNYGRFPNISLYNPTGNTNPFNTSVVYAGATNRFPTPGWLGHVYGTSPVVASNPTTATEHYLFDADPSLLPGGLTEGLPGEFWTVDNRYDGTNLLDTIVVYKGVWNSATSDVDWGIHAKITAGWDLTSDGVPHAVNPNIAFSTDGMTGWIGTLGDVVGGDNDHFYSPIFIKSTDGGATWGAPIEVDLNGTPWVADSLQAFWVNIDSLTGDTIPASDGRATTAFDFDITVDVNGNPHIATVVGTGAATQDYSISSGLTKFLGDISSPDGGSTWEVTYMGAVLAFRGEFGTPDPNSGDLLTMDNTVQISRNATGSHIFYSWNDNDTVNTGFGESTNLAPDLRIAGLRVSDGAQTCVRKMTDDDFIWAGRALFPTLSPTTLTKGSSYHMPLVMIEMITNNQLEPCKFWYFGNDCVLQESEFTDPSNLNLSAEGFCLGVGIEENQILPEEAQLFQSYPNPADNQATIRFELLKSGDITLNMINIYGQEVMRIAEGNFATGTHEIDINTAKLAPGVYYYNLRSGDTMLTNKMVITR